MSFRDLIGHDEVGAALRGALLADRLPHALLFAGPQGVGKATAALALCMARFCRAPGTAGDACAACAACRAVLHGNHPDLDRVQREPGKRDIGIASMRALLEILHRKPVNGPRRAVIVDDAHRLTIEAQNAFLKTLEEPPQGALVIVVTSSPERLLPTVQSRCARFRFAPLDAAGMEEFARRHAIDVTRVPIALARGSPGVLLSFTSGGMLQAREDVLAFLADLERASPHALSERLVRCAADQAPGADAPAEEQEDARELTRERLLRFVRLMESALRDVQVLAAGGAASMLYHGDRAELLAVIAARSDIADLLEAMLACEEGVRDLRRNVDPPLALEGMAQRVKRALIAVR